MFESDIWEYPSQHELHYVQVSFPTPRQKIIVKVLDVFLSLKY